MVGADRPNQAAYDKGVAYADEMVYLAIAANNVWSGQASNGGYVSSYEKIGYHAGSVDFIIGAMAGGCPVYAYHDGGWHRVVL